MPKEFIEWFVGFTDGEGNFLIKLDSSKKSVSFRFKINLHRDELNTLKYIHQNLGVGRVKILSDKAVTFEITDPNEIGKIIIPLFTDYPLLNLNFLMFKQAFEM